MRTHCPHEFWRGKKTKFVCCQCGLDFTSPVDADESGCPAG